MIHHWVHCSSWNCCFLLQEKINNIFLHSKLCKSLITEMQSSLQLWSYIINCIWKEKLKHYTTELGKWFEPRSISGLYFVIIWVRVLLKRSCWWLTLQNCFERTWWSYLVRCMKHWAIILRFLLWADCTAWKLNILAQIHSNTDRRTLHILQCSDVFDYGWLEYPGIFY